MTNVDSNLNAQWTNDRDRSDVPCFRHFVIRPPVIDSSFIIRHSSFRRRGGFTLIELVLVLLIITLALAAAAPSLAGFQSGRNASDTAAQFVAVTHYARTQAISEGTICRVNIDLPGGRWWITQDDGTGAFVQLKSNDGRTYTAPSTIRLATTAPLVDGANVIEFNPTGRTDLATVTFTSTDGSVLQVTCDSPFDVYHIVTRGGAK